MDMENVGLYLLIWVKVFLLLKAQVTFHPDPAVDVPLQQGFLTPPVEVTTTQFYPSSPKFKVQYVTADNKVVFDIRNAMDGSPIHENACESPCQYSLMLDNLAFLADPELVGGTFRLKATLNNDEQNSTFSRRTYTFAAPFNLTGPDNAVLNFPFTWTCHVTSGYDVIQWKKDNIEVALVGIFSNGSCSILSQDKTYIYSCQPPTYTLTIPGTSLTKDMQNKTWRCKNVTNELEGSRFMRFNIVYPPTVSINLQNTTENTLNHIIRCTAVGKPNNVTIVALEQRIGSTLIRNITSFTESSPGNITLTIPRMSYQDMGTYTCLASNGIPNRSNQTIQKDTAFLNVNSSAKFEIMQYIVRSDIGTPAVMSIPFYRNPPASENDVVWTRNTGTKNETLEASNNFSFLLRDADVQQTFYGVDVTLRGQSAIMNITSFLSYYEGNYSLKIRGSPKDSEEVKILIVRSGPPDTPSHFQLMTKNVTSIVLSWTKGSDGGHPQTFVIFYKEKTSQVYTKKQLNDTSMDNKSTDEVKNLKPDTSYVFILYSFNEKGNSTGHQTLEERTLKAPVVSAPSSLNAGLVGGAAGGGIAVLVVVIVIIVVVQRRRQRGGKGNEYNSRETLAWLPRGNGDDKDGDGLKDNPLHGGSPGGANVLQGASDAPENPSVYAEVVKLKKKNPAKVNEDPPPINAEVDKSSKKNAEGKQKKQNTKDKAGGEQYQNMDGFKQTGSTQQKAKENEQRGYKNKDGLFYMDVKFDQPPARGKPTIRKEEPTGYAMIQFEEPSAKPTPNNARDAEGGQ